MSVARVLLVARDWHWECHKRSVGWLGREVWRPRYTELASGSDQFTFPPKKRVGGPVSRGCFSLGLVTYSLR